jgi:hypothetical protein
MCFMKTPDAPRMPTEKQPQQLPKDQAISAADRTKDRLRAGAQTILTGPGGSNNASTTMRGSAGGTILGRVGTR